MSHDSCPTILTQSVAQCAQICADGGATIKQSPRLMALSQSADVDARTRGFFSHGLTRNRLLEGALTVLTGRSPVEATGVAGIRRPFRQHLRLCVFGELAEPRKLEREEHEHPGAV